MSGVTRSVLSQAEQEFIRKYHGEEPPQQALPRTLNYQESRLMRVIHALTAIHPPNPLIEVQWGEIEECVEFYRLQDYERSVEATWELIGEINSKLASEMEAKRKQHTKPKPQYLQ